MPRAKAPVRIYRRDRSPYWWARYSTPAGEEVRVSTRCTEYGAALRVATEWWRAAQHEAADAVCGVERASDVTMLGLADVYLTDAKTRLRPSTVTAYVGHLRTYVLPYFGADTRAASLTPQACEGFRRALASGGLDSPRAGHRRTALPSPATVNRVCTVLRQVLEFGVAEGLLTANPAARLRKRKERTRSQFRALTNAEVDALRRELATPSPVEPGRGLVASDPAPEAAAWLMFSVETGLRRGEVDRLQWADVDAERRVVRVRGADAKSGVDRWVPLTRAALDALDSLRGDEPRVGAVFRTYTNGRRWLLAAAWGRAGLPGRVPSAHDLRVTFATRALARGLDVHQLREAMGHRTLMTTERYVRALSPSRWAEMARKMDGGEG